MNNAAKKQAIAEIDRILRESEYEDGSYGGTFAQLEHDFFLDLKAAREYGDDRVVLKLGVEVSFPIDLVETADPQEASWSHLF